MNTNPRPQAVLVMVTALTVICLCLCAATAAADDKARPRSTPAPKPYALIFGTAYGPDDRPMYGVKVTIRPQGRKHPSWELTSDHRGEFAQRVPPGPGDYVATGEVEVIPVENGKPHKAQKKRLKGEAKIHVAGEEEHDFSLHLQ